MSDLFGNHIVGFPTRQLISRNTTQYPGSGDYISACLKNCNNNEPPRGKTNNVVSEQVRHKPACTITEDG